MSGRQTAQKKRKKSGVIPRGSEVGNSNLTGISVEAGRSRQDLNNRSELCGERKKFHRGTRWLKKQNNAILVDGKKLVVTTIYVPARDTAKTEGGVKKASELRGSFKLWRPAGGRTRKKQATTSTFTQKRRQTETTKRFEKQEKRAKGNNHLEWVERERSPQRSICKEKIIL